MGAAADEERGLLLPRSSNASGGLPGPLARLRVAASGGAVRVLLAFGVAAAWMAVSSILILVNKHILKDLGFGYPMTVSGLGMATSGCLSYLVCRSTAGLEARANITPAYWVRRIMPVGFFMAATLWAGNLVYLHLSVSFIQMLKAFTPVITMIALFIARLETPTLRMVLSVCGIAAGTALAAYGEIHNSLLGLAIMFTSEACEAVRLVMTQLLLTGLKMGPFEGVMWMAPACCVWLLLGACLTEWPGMVAAGKVGVPVAHPGLFLAAAVLGFAVNVLAYATIKLASSLTLKVLGCVKNGLVIVAAMALYGEVVTLTQGIGYAIATSAFMLYVHIKMGHIAAGGGDGGGGGGGSAGGGGAATPQPKPVAQA